MDEQTAKRLATMLTEHRGDIVNRWMNKVRRSLQGRQTGAELERQTEELYGALVASLASGSASLDSPSAADLRSILRGLSKTRARQGFTATETAISVFSLKDAISDVTSETAAKPEIAELFGLVDRLGLYTFETYVNARESIIVEQSTQLLELSTPVVKLWDGVVAVPLIGTLDSARSQVVMERLLQALVETGSPYAILDITGVPAVDTQVAQHIMKTVVAAQLMGARCIISGIRPQIAQTIVSLGIEFGEIVTKATLADALQYALHEIGFDVVRRGERPRPA